jgi:hypothetical protein
MPGINMHERGIQRRCGHAEIGMAVARTNECRTSFSRISAACPRLVNETTGISEMDSSLFIVSPSANGKWNVVEEGFAKPITFFDNKNDAVDYATAVAKTRPSSRIGIRNGMGSLETMLQFEAGKSAEGV